MSILIKGLTMPKDGEMLCVNIYPDGKVCINLDLSCEAVGEATAVPPHGRCIDADLVICKAVEKLKATHYAGYLSSINLVEWAPTILPADTEDE